MSLHTISNPELASRYTPEVGEIETRRSFARLIRSRLGLDADATDAAVLDRVHNLLEVVDRVKEIITRPTPLSFRVEVAEMCDGPCGQTCREAANGVWTGCTCDWHDMVVLEVQEDGEVAGLHDEVRVCDCGISWACCRCDDCQAEADRLDKADHDCHAAREESVA